MSREKIATKEVAEDLSGVVIAFVNDKTLTVNLSDLTEEMVVNLALHGLKQKLGDSYSGESNLEVAFSKAENVAKRLREGNWKAVRESGSGGRITDLAQALSRVTNRSIPESVEVIDGLTKEGKSKLRAHPDIKVAMTEIAAERARAAAENAAPVDLAELGV